jgi:ligand-binding SRPBCC domain-containing protein
VPRFEVVTLIAAPPDRVFDVSLDVDVHTASMARSGEQIIGGVMAGRLEPGESVTWQARHFGLKWRMTSKITAWDRPAYFADEQVAGPFRHWHHSHHFQPGELGDTVMRDVINHAAPLGALGAIAEVLALCHYMPRLIRLRNHHIKTVAEAAPGPSK